jgi:hypothetical protein
MSNMHLNVWHTLIVILIFVSLNLYLWRPESFQWRMFVVQSTGFIIEMNFALFGTLACIFVAILLPHHHHKGDMRQPDTALPKQVVHFVLKTSGTEILLLM